MDWVGVSPAEYKYIWVWDDKGKRLDVSFDNPNFLSDQILFTDVLGICRDKRTVCPVLVELFEVLAWLRMNRNYRV